MFLLIYLAQAHRSLCTIFSSFCSEGWNVSYISGLCLPKKRKLFWEDLQGTASPLHFEFSKWKKSYLKFDIFMLCDHMFWEKLTGFEFFITIHAFPDFFLLVFSNFFSLSNKNFHLFSQNSHIVLGLGALFYSFFSFLLDLLKDSLNIL